MSTLRHNYSGLITKGLGLPACNGLITMHLSVFHVYVQVSSTPGGGGYAVHPVTPYYTPTNQTSRPISKRLIKNRTIDIAIKFTDTKTWRKSFMVTEERAKHVVKVINIVNTLIKSVQLSIFNIKQRLTKR